MKEYDYRIAGFILRLSLPAAVDPDRLLPSFRPFRLADGAGGESPLCRFVAGASQPVAQGGGTLLEEGSGLVLGHSVRLFGLPDGYCLELQAQAGSVAHHLHADSRFTTARAALDWADPRVGRVVCSMLRITFSQAVLPHGAVSLHAAAVTLGGRAYLFMGRSGTGKSTHAALWQRCFTGCRLLNDDTPTVRLAPDGRPVAYGTPWSGKTPCYKNESAPVGGIVRLRQAEANRFERSEEVDAFVDVLPGCAVVPDSTALRDALCATLLALTSAVTVGRLDCRPDEEAARLCAAALGADAR